VARKPPTISAHRVFVKCVEHSSQSGNATVRSQHRLLWVMTMVLVGNSVLLLVGTYGRRCNVCYHGGFGEVLSGCVKIAVVQKVIEHEDLRRHLLVHTPSCPR